MTRPLINFSTNNPSGDKPGMEPVRLDLLRAAVENTPTPPPASPHPARAHKAEHAARQTHASIPLVNKNIRLPADLIEFIDFTYTKDKRMKKQDAYTEALEAYFRPLMKQQTD